MYRIGIILFFVTTFIYGQNTPLELQKSPSHLFDLIELVKQDPEWMNSLSQLKESKKTKKQEKQEKKTVADVYKSLSSKNGKTHQMHFLIDRDSSIQWSQQPYITDEIFSTIGVLKMNKLVQKDTYGIFTLFKLNLGTFDIPWEEIMQFFFLYIKDANKKSSENIQKIKKKYPQLSLQEQFFLARFSHDLPNTYRHLTKFFVIESAFIEPDTRQIHFRFKPKINIISEYYPEEAKGWQKANSIDSSFILKSKENNVIAKLYWDKERTVFDFRASIPENLPERMTLTTNIHFAHTGMAIHIENFDIDIVLSNKNFFYLGANINKVPDKVEISGFWSLFLSATSLKKFFRTLIYMNENKGSELRLYYFTKKDKKYLQMEIYVSLKGTAKMGKEPQPKINRFEQDGTKALITDYERYLRLRKN